jgi:hypothetical protein
VIEPDTHSFIVKIWLEEHAQPPRRATWRGYITHVPTGERYYFVEVDEIAEFLIPYLQRLGADVGLTWRIRWPLCRRHRPGRAKR